MKLSKDEIQCLALLDKCGIPAHSCYLDKKFITFFIPNRYYRSVLRKVKSRSQTLKKKFSKTIELFPYDENLEKCLELSLKAFGVNPLAITLKGETVLIKLSVDDKGKIFKNISKFKRFKELLKNTFEIKTIKV
ncbi:MAG: hypothetical protein DRO04_00350 [Candidatus Iainarchaeum archaeon]|uniref:Uncharacterized protein n=1 Tax=Candidatus Iainarchaeum sp. TaxID=3101447 RepID=A0A497JJ64_9ARCH|nr:MAG: hypothetical protein DRO04_00350 [Candidatus Diapherotrites archaeon]